MSSIIDIKFELESNKLDSIKADATIVIVKNKDLSHKWVTQEDELKVQGFEGSAEELCQIGNNIYVGVPCFDSDEIRLALCNALKKIKKSSYKTISIGSYSSKRELNISAIVEGAILGSYKFDKYFTKKSSINVEKIIISTEDYSDNKIDETKANEEIKFSFAVANATNMAKTIVNSTPNDVTPQRLAQLAKELTIDVPNTNCFIGDNEYLESENMNLFLAVNRASCHPAKLVHLSYTPKNPKKVITLVGKGLTYDSGGLNIKTGSYMSTMKADKGGACAVLGIFKAITELKLDVELHAVIGATENMVGGDAYKADDVIIARNKDSVEIQNTDAEGRLVLADCLSWAQDKIKSDYILDFATLTGACVVGLGEYTTGIMGNNSKLKHQIGANNSGELSSMLPFNKYLKKTLKSPVADICNISSSRYGGAITAGLFLDNFITDEYKDKWVHLDIAGPAFVERDWGYNQTGASGAGVRLVSYWINKLIKD
ncbi:MAG: Cytosol aminopeptidase PepA (EC [uncultured Campylobacterales bacterium]|uniref:Cytosol aminopeptidase PepA (EC) n=1 Tax=uncultured Campylobacterales bacterium TaxID=352960 RepID=A0A6S6SG87_9BACT|nr:MAG: Cytosol aminopeptidase PepA (EC [uncultured Campylobacterales bacterium]